MSSNTTNAVVDKANISLRHNKKFQVLLKASNDKPFDDDLLAQYVEEFPEYENRAKCAKKVIEMTASTVGTAVEETWCYFPFEKIDYAKDKCIRDESLTVMYITNSMLMNDNEWLKDALLYWMRTIVQAQGFPGISPNEELIAKQSEANLKSLKTLVSRSRSLPDHISAIFVTYTRLAQRFNSKLTGEEWALIRDQFRSTVDILTMQ